MPDEEVRVTSSTGAQKGSKLARYDLIPAEPLRQLSERYGLGASKYAERNWEMGYDWSLSFAALNRHLWQFWNGEDYDPETPGQAHLAAVAFHVFALLEFMNTHPEFDNRPNTAKPEVIQINGDLVEGVTTTYPKFWTDPKTYVTYNVDWSNPAPDFWYYEYASDWPNILASEGDPIDANIDELEINLPDEILFHVLNPEVFGEFKPVEAFRNVPTTEAEVLDLLVPEEKPFKVGDLVNVHGYKVPATVSNIDWHADQLRLVFDAAEYVEWINTNRCTKVS